MENTKIMVKVAISANKEKVWEYYTKPKHIVNWNFADPSWHCPSASNDLNVGGTYIARMEAKDGSFGFDFEAVYTEVNPGENFSYTFGGRTANVQLMSQNNETEIIVTFEAENEHPIEMQSAGWQAILNNFKTYTESN